ncbi:MAG: carboxymuconolactone decarboxylase family protein [Candidatus Eisenbacteria bacterium]|uniref:Carboxymuconolactone decarboxylase family protein n=1 Tax=Eiseniibacteriota bacterium TaxID=2212470 RepID=A0A933SG89_UNCEI|nr:carboxymuconolactone decarboxylase family protein [Candidatus Eisenbacteria bacterium]
MGASSTATALRRRRGVFQLCRFAALVARREFAAAAQALASARAHAVTRAAAEESALMLMLYAGYPAALEGLRVLNGAWPGRARRSREGGVGAWVKRGEALCSRVYGPSFVKLVPAVQALHPDLARWMIEHGYGRVLSRPGMGARDRELVTVAALAALGWERQLVSHLLGARRVGATLDEVQGALAAGLARTDAAAERTALSAWRRLTEAEAAGAAPLVPRRRDRAAARRRPAAKPAR